ncbi:MAG: PfkB family carbohydrate kinase [Deltaproteobacteria bacterium]|nr:PfkB family carbohydrate kinase [Deltaproteobacteria bacterium]
MPGASRSKSAKPSATKPAKIKHKAVATGERRAVAPKPVKRTAKPIAKPQAAKPTPQKPNVKATAGATPRLIVGVGLATVDMLCVAPRIGDRLVELSVFSMQGGGTVGNMVATAAALGAPARFFGRVGDDDFGRYITRGLEAYKVDCSMVTPQPGAMSPLSIVQIDELSRRRKILTTRGSVTPLTPKDLPRKLLDGAALLCIDGYNPAVQAVVAEKARDRGVPVLLNASHLVGGMGELLGIADIVIGSERFANEFAPSDKVEQSLSEIVRLGPKTAVITLGNDGAIALEGDKLVQQGSLDVFVADSTGAGDVFCGAFAYATVMGWPLEKALSFANTTAGLRCRSIGAREGIPNLKEVLEALEPE